MILRHCTPAFNLPSIDNSGLLPSMAKSDRQRVWLVVHRLTQWGILHVARRHKVDPAEVRVLTVSVPRGWLRSFASGVWYTERIIPPARIHGSPIWHAGLTQEQQVRELGSRPAVRPGGEQSS